MSAAKSIPSTLTPAARTDRAMRLLRESIVELVKATLDEGNAVAEWVDQNHSPLGKRRHLELARTKRIASKKHGKLVLIRRDDMNAYIEQKGLARGHRIEEDDVVDIIDRVTARGKR